MKLVYDKFWQVTRQTQVAMDIGEVRVAEDADFNRLKSLCDDTNGWKQEYNKNNTTVWTKINELSEFQMVKVSILIFCNSVKVNISFVISYTIMFLKKLLYLIRISCWWFFNGNLVFLWETKRSLFSIK